MRIGNRCGPYGCHNGAPFGNASIFSGLGTPEQLLSARCLRNFAVVAFCAFAAEACFHVSVLTPLVKAAHSLSHIVMRLTALLLAMSLLKLAAAMCVALYL